MPRENRTRAWARGALHEAVRSQTLSSLPGTAKFKTWQGVSDFGRVSLQEVKSITTGEAQDAGLVSTGDAGGAVGGSSDTLVREHLTAYLCHI